MNYRHITISFSVEGLSPSKIVSELEKEGYKALYSNLIKSYCEFLDIKDPFKIYKKIEKPSIDVDAKLEVLLARSRALTISRGGYRYAEARKRGYLPVDYGEKRYQKLFGDLFKYGKNPKITFCFYDDSSEREKSVWFACWTNEDTELHEPLERFITTFSKVVGCEKPIDEIKTSDTFTHSHSSIIDDLKEYNLKEAVFGEKKSTFEILSDEECRTALMELNKKGNVLLSEFLGEYKGEEKEQKKKLLKFLTGQKFLNKELIVICKETGQWWNVSIQSREKMKEIEELGISCTSCGAKIGAERVDEFYKMNEKGKKLISGSYWMVGRIVNELLKLGVRENEVFVGVTHNSEEIDILAFFMSRLIVFELKDREFGLGDSYRFHGKISRLNEKVDRPIYPIVVTTKTVASEAKKLLEEVTGKEIPYEFIEGLESLNELIKKIFDEILKDVISLRMEAVRAKFPGVLLITEPALM